MKTAILSDIHANLQALEAVLEDCEKQGVGEYWLLGDYIDYGANPVEVIKLLSDLGNKITHAIGGNHDAGLFGLTNKIIDDYTWYTERLFNENYKDFDWLRKIAATETEYALDGKAILVHGSIRNPYWGGPSAWFVHFHDLDQHGCDWIFCGHTHHQLIKTKNNAYFTGNEPVNISGQKAIINPGSVGQPRNGSTKANYAILEDNIITFRRVRYDIDAAVNAIKDAGLPDWCGTRLYSGW